MSDGLQIFDDALAHDPARAAEDADPAQGAAETRPARRPKWPGGLAGGVAILMVFSWAGGLALLSAGGFELGVGLTVSAIILSVIAILAGTVAAVGDFGRGWGIAGILVGVLLNPVLLLFVLSWLGAL